MTSWRPGWEAFPQPLLDFWTERHLCSLTTLRPDGSPHVFRVGCALDLVVGWGWVITLGTSLMAANGARDGRVAVCAVDGGRWSTLEGTVTVREDEASVQRAVDRYAARYRQPQPNPLRVALRIEVDRFLVSPALV